MGTVLDIELRVPLAVDPGNLGSGGGHDDTAGEDQTDGQSVSQSTRRSGERDVTHETTFRPPPPQPPSLNVNRQVSD